MYWLHQRNQIFTISRIDEGVFWLAVYLKSKKTRKKCFEQFLKQSIHLQKPHFPSNSLTTVHKTKNVICIWSHTNSATSWIARHKSPQVITTLELNGTPNYKTIFFGIRNCQCDASQTVPLRDFLKKTILNVEIIDEHHQLTCILVSNNENVQVIQKGINPSYYTYDLDADKIRDVPLSFGS